MELYNLQTSSDQRIKRCISDIYVGGGVNYYFSPCDSACSRAPVSLTQHSHPPFSPARLSHPPFSIPRLSHPPVSSIRHSLSPFSPVWHGMYAITNAVRARRQSEPAKPSRSLLSPGGTASVIWMHTCSLLARMYNPCALRLTCTSRQTLAGSKPEKDPHTPNPDRSSNPVGVYLHERCDLYKPQMCNASKPDSLMIRANRKTGKYTVALGDERNDIGYTIENGKVFINDKLFFRTYIHLIHLFIFKF